MTLLDLVAGLPVSLLIAVAVWHRVRVVRLGQSTWKGGGFAMFSSADTRAVITELILPDRTRLPIPATVMPLRRLWAVVVPTNARLAAWALEVAGSRWQRCGAVAHYCAAVAEPLSFVAVAVKHVTMTFDLHSGLYCAETKPELVFHVGEHP